MDKNKLITPKELKDKQLSEQEEIQALQKQAKGYLGTLVQLPGYKYLKIVALSYIVKPYECDPPKRDEDATKWQTYNTIRWAFERFFNLVELIAGESPKP